ncbi:MAG TPA: nuclear transport factor 2 family protein [Solirubrobacteraceae bacterium]|nr:nuclear transport factor 2 family protein [Solirubrobacteraceae bacterium]
MPDPATIVRTYIEMWNETDPQRRRELVSATLTDDASYLDPIMAGQGVEEISDMIGAAQAQHPSHRFELVDGPDAHHDRVRFTWSLGSPAGEPVAVGVDFATTADDGRMRDVTGFLEPAA